MSLDFILLRAQITLLQHFSLFYIGVGGATALIVLSISRLSVDDGAGMVEKCSLKIDSLCLIQVRGGFYVPEKCIKR